jgi:hypothetical protein
LRLLTGLRSFHQGFQLGGKTHVPLLSLICRHLQRNCSELSTFFARIRTQ